MSKVILVVDDSMSVRRVVSMALNTAGYQVIQGRDGQHALEQFVGGTHVDLVVCDFHMPKMNGIEFVGKIRELANCKYTPVIMLTNESDEDLKAQGKKAGVRAWLLKPFDGEQMLATVKKLMPG